MFCKRSVAAVFAIAIASSLIVVISSSLVDPAYAFAPAKRQYQQDISPAVVSVPFSVLSAGSDEDESRSITSHVLNTAGDDSVVIAKDMNMWKEECNDT